MDAILDGEAVTAEAVIITGPRRGQFVKLTDETASLDDPAVEAALSNLVTAFEELVQNARRRRRGRGVAGRSASAAG